MPLLFSLFTDIIPKEVQQNALKNLVKCAEEMKKVKQSYEIIGYHQFESTMCPNGKLYDIIAKFCVNETP